MKKTLSIISLVVAATIGQSLAKVSYPRTVDMTDRKQLSEQSNSMVKLITPLVKKVSESVVSIKVNQRQVAFGTVTSKGILTKWSEVSRFASQAYIVTADGKSSKLKIIGVYEGYDLVLLSNETGLIGVDMTKKAASKLGDFIVMAGVAGQPAGFGVVSVEKRSLREADKAFLGIQMNFKDFRAKGIFIDKVVEGSGAKVAGLLPADRILAIDGAELGSPIEARSIIQRLKPGQRIKLSISRNGVAKVLDVLLGTRPKVAQFPKFPKARLNRMERLGGAISAVRTGFPSSVQSDMQVEANLMGAPVIDLNGNFVGVSISRSRMKTHIIPADALAKLLEVKPSPATAPLAKSHPSQQNRGQEARNLLNLHQKQFKNMEQRMKLMREEMKRFEEEMRRMER